MNTSRTRALLLCAAAALGQGGQASFAQAPDPTPRAREGATVRIGAAQPRSRLVDHRLKEPAAVLARVDAALGELEKLVEKAGAAGCAVVAFPEDVLGLGTWEAANAGALKDVLPEAVRRMLERLGRAAAAHRMYIVCANDTVEPGGAVHNTAFFLGRDGKEIGRYHKVNLPIHEQDKKRGDGFPVFQTADLGTVGLLICYDMVFPEAPRCLALAGADIIFHPTLGGAAIGDEDISRAAFRTRAVENFVYLVVSQRGGGAMIISPQGKVLAEGKEPDDIAVADIDPSGGREGGDAMNHQADMRARLFRERSPAAYRILTDPRPPVLEKVPETIRPADAVRIAAGALTTGEERFKEADALRGQGKIAEAARAYEKLRAEFPGSWIDRVARERLAAMGAGGERNSSPGPPGDTKALLERLRKENPGEYEKVRQLPPDAAEAFLREKYGKPAAESGRGGEKKGGPPPEKKAGAPAGEKGATAAEKKSGTPEAKKAAAVEQAPLPPRRERFEVVETVRVGDFAVDLCRREDGAFGVGEIRRGEMPVRRADFLITWQVGGKFPVLERREGMRVLLREPRATLTFSPESRTCAGTALAGLRCRFETEAGGGTETGRRPIVETASWELGGTTAGLSYFDGYRGWHAPPGWRAASAIAPTNPKLTPSLLHGTGFQLEHGAPGALLVFHTSPGDRLANASRGEALEFVTTFDGPSAVDRFIFTLAGESRINLWTRAFEVAQAELRRALGLPEPRREVICIWPPFGRRGFRETAEAFARTTAREGFTAVSIDVVWDNLEFHGGKKNMNIWDYSVCDGYGGEAGLRALVEECRKHDLRVIAWVPAGHLNAGAPVWREHPDWILRNADGEKALNPSGLLQGDLNTGFADYFRGRIAGVVRAFGLDGLWLDSHLAYAQQYQSPAHGARLAAIYRDFSEAGARLLIAEGDASALGAYGVAIGEDWEEAGGKIPDPDLYYGAILMSGFNDGRLHRRHFRRYVASGAAWAVRREFLDSPKLEGEEIESARRDALQVIQDYRRVKDRMVHRYVHEDGSGYTWTNDRDRTKVVWLLEDALLPDGRQGRAGTVEVIEPRA